MQASFNRLGEGSFELLPSQVGKFNTSSLCNCFIAQSGSGGYRSMVSATHLLNVNEASLEKPAYCKVVVLDVCPSS